MTKTYSHQQHAVLLAMQVRGSGASLLCDWSGFVDECEEGYAWDYAEYLHELRVRRLLDVVAKAPVLTGYDEHTLFCAQLETTDVRFRALLQHDITVDSNAPWWRAGVLIFAGPAYADYMAEAHGIAVRRCRDE